MQVSTVSTATEHKANTAFFKVMQSAPMGLLVCAALGLAIVGVFQFIFYFLVLPADWNMILLGGLSASLAIFFEGLGFYFLVTTVRDFSGGHRKEGWIGFGATLLLWAYALWEATHIAASFDRDTPETYWSILGIVGTIVCIVRIVELRITLTVTSAMVQQQAEITLLTQLESERKQLAEVSGKLAIYEAETQRAIEAEKRQQENARALEAENARLEQERKHAAYLQAQEEIERLQRRLEKQSPRNSPTVSDTGRESMMRKAREFFNRNNIIPTQQQVAEMVGLRDAKSVRLQFPNGSWDAFIETLQPENNLVVNS